mgnify:CR=1 FL=1
MCGDHSKINSKFKMARGSPPHVRGPQARSNLQNIKLGITPACAGTTSFLFRFFF